MSLTTYNLIHVLGLAAVLVSLGGLTTLVAGGNDPRETGQRGLLMALHGVGMILLIVAGFGMLARLGISGMPSWVWMKLVIWIILGVIPFWIRRSPGVAKPLIWLLPLLPFAAAYLALYR